MNLSPSSKAPSTGEAPSFPAGSPCRRAEGLPKQHPVSEVSEKGRGSRHKWRKFIPALPLTL